MTTSAFGPLELQRALAAAIPTNLPPEHHNAVVLAVDDSGVTAAVAFTRPAFGATWSSQVAYVHTWQGDNKIGAKFVGSW